MDDVFSICKRDRLSELLEFLNRQDSNIQFTVQTETNGALPFLDTNAQRTDDEKIRTSVYRKSTHSGRVLLFQSRHPISAKKATAKALFDRVYTHYKEDDVEGQREETRTVLAELHNNGYSKRFVRVIMDKH